MQDRSSLPDSNLKTLAQQSLTDLRLVTRVYLFSSHVNNYAIGNSPSFYSMCSSSYINYSENIAQNACINSFPSKVSIILKTEQY